VGITKVGLTLPSARNKFLSMTLHTSAGQEWTLGGSSGAYNYVLGNGLNTVFVAFNGDFGGASTVPQRHSPQPPCPPLPLGPHPCADHPVWLSSLLVRCRLQMPRCRIWVTGASECNEQRPPSRPSPSALSRVRLPSDRPPVYAFRSIAFVRVRLLTQCLSPSISI
jgi:hypothetical protein